MSDDLSVTERVAVGLIRALNSSGIRERESFGWHIGPRPMSDREILDEWGQQVMPLAEALVDAAREAKEA